MKRKHTFLEDKIQALLLDDWFVALKPWMKGVNIFDALRISRSENRHSDMLAWLLDPHGSHGLGSDCLEGFVRAVCSMRDRMETTEFLAFNWKCAKVFREWGDGKDRIDLLIEGERTLNKSFIIAIENKIDSLDAKGQLDKYRRMVVERWPEEYKRGQHLFVYLTPNGDDPVYAEGNEDWIRFSYREVVRFIEESTADKTMGTQNVAALIDDYRNLIRRDIVMDEKLVRLCNAIYKKHKEAFDLIFKNADMDGCYKQAKDVIEGIVRENNPEFIYTGDKSGTQSVLSFQSKEMNKVLMPLKDGEHGTWNNSDVYYYWFDIDRRTSKIKLVVEFGPRNIAIDEKCSMRVMGKIINGKKKLDNGVYRRMKSYLVMDVREDAFDERKLSKKVKESIEQLRVDEREWIKEYYKSEHTSRGGD